MSHSVHFRDAAGEVQLEDTATLDAALERVEHLRNDEGATEIRVFREVPIEVRTYYRVTAVDEARATAEVAEVADMPAVPDAEVDDVEPVAAVARLEPPSGAMVMSPPPVSAVPDVPASEEAELATEPHGGDHRRQLFSRS